MALTYKNQGKLEKLSAKTGIANSRISDQADVVFGGRGGHYDEIQYLRNQNTDAAGVNVKFSDAVTKFGPANGAVGTRADQIEHDFDANGTYP